MLVNFLKSIDLFGKTFNFQIQEKKLVKSTAGGILSLTLFIISLVFTFYFGKNFLFRLSPTMASENILVKEAPFQPVNSLNFSLGTFLDTDNGTILIPDYLEINAYQAFYRKIENNGQIDYFSNRTKLNLTRCINIDDINEEMRNNINYDIMYCIHIDEDLLIGGNWDDWELSTLEFDLSINKSSNKSITEINSLLKSQFTYFNLCYPDYLLQPNNFEDPLQTVFKTNYNNISLLKYYYNTLTFNMVYLYDDIGWIIESLNQYQSVFLSQVITRFDVNTLEELIDKTNDIPIVLAQNIILFGKDYFVHRRKFMKIQEVLALVGGILKSITVLYFFLGFTINQFHIDLILINEVFDFYDLNEFSTIKKKILKKVELVSSVSDVSNISDIRINNKSDRRQTNNSIFVNYEDDGQYYKNSNYKQNKLLSHLNRESAKRKLSREQNKPKYTFCYYIKLMTCGHSKKNTLLDLRVKVAKNYIYSKLDLQYYLEMCSKFNRLLSVIFDSNQLKLFNLEYKHNLFAPNESSNDQENYLELINYFTSKHEEYGLDEMDKKLIYATNPVIKKYIKI